jgi:hypothetical protein
VKAQGNTALQNALRMACEQSFHFWLNGFGWTFRQKEVMPDGTELPVKGHKAHQPFITWPVQDEFASHLIDAIDTGKNVDIEKSRDMGASWLILSVFTWLFQYRYNVNFLLLSRKEDLVDKPGNMDSLFEKIRYLLKFQPTWLRPHVRSTYMSLVNTDRKSTITGESTNADAGRGGRKTAAMVDEAAAIRNAEEIENALSQNTPCIIWNSTPRGPGTWFYKRIKERRGLILQLPWWRHPEKAAGGNEVFDPVSGRITWTSPWYRKQQERLSKKALAQEIDMDHGQAGDMFFDLRDLERHRRDHVKNPLASGDLRPVADIDHEDRVDLVRRRLGSKLIFISGGYRKPWRLWVPLIEGRPSQDMTYVFGIDISNGAGSSNSVITVLAAEANMIVAKFWDANTSPEELAIAAAEAGVWFGGRKGPAFIVWENNGPGGIFGRKLVKLGYPNFYRLRQEGTINKKRTPRWGWHSNQERKEVLLGMYREALAQDRIINPCLESIEEAGDYIYDDTGLLVPGKLREEPSGGRQLHGDHVIADALVVLGREELPKQLENSLKPPAGSFAHRRQMHQARLKQNEWSR